MKETVLDFATEVPACADAVFAWHAREGAFERLTPPWSRAAVIEREGGVAPGARTVIRMPVGPTSVRWIAEHGQMIEGREFSDRQVEGPFAKWEHVHGFEPLDASTSVLRDRIRYALPWGAASGILAGRFVRREVERVFAYRHRTTKADLALHTRYSAEPLSIAITGASGLVGGAVSQVLSTGGHRVRHLGRTRPAAGTDFVCWDSSKQPLNPTALAGADAVVHLAGENIAAGRWNAQRKRRIRDSRVDMTRALAEAAAAQPKRPRVLVCASAIGYYGSRDAQWMREESSPDDDFLAQVCREWEAACAPARDAGIRVVNLRIGVVLSARGGALAKMLPPFRMGAGGVVGSGEQYMSWIGLDDLAGIVLHAICDDTMSGPVNAVSPQPVTNREYTKTLGRLLSRPTIAPLPAFAARLAFGEMADALLLSSTRVDPTKLKTAGFDYRAATVDQVLADTLGRSRAQT